MSNEVFSRRPGPTRGPRRPHGDPWGTMGSVGTPTGGTTGRYDTPWRRHGASRTPLRQRWVLSSALAGACALGVAGVLSLGDGQGIRVPVAVVVRSSSPPRPVTAALPDGGTGRESTSTGAGPGEAASEEGVTIVTATPQVVVEPSDAESAAAPASDAPATSGQQNQATTLPASWSTDGGTPTPAGTSGSANAGAGGGTPDN